LRRLDLAVEVARRQEESQVPLRTAEAAITAVAEWMRISVTTFLSSETISLMGIKDPGEFRSYFGQRFVGNLHLIVKSADKTCSAIPAWAKERIETAWNIKPDWRITLLSDSGGWVWLGICREHDVSPRTHYWTNNLPFMFGWNMQV
jgi:hypothetical protein